SDTIRQEPMARQAMTAGLQRQLERLGCEAPGADSAGKRRAAIGSWAAMVGAMILARMSEDRNLSDEILEQTRAWINDKTSAATGLAGSTALTAHTNPAVPAPAVADQQKTPRN